MAEGSNDSKRWLSDYFDLYRKSIFEPEPHTQIVQLRDEMRSVTDAGGKILLGGNGGGAAIASHCAVDLTKNAGLRAVCFSDSSLVTCFANDYGYERWIEKALAFYADKGDLAILISCSGRSLNIVNGAKHARRTGLKVVTFSGFDGDNPLRSLGELNFWVDSRAYNIVEMTLQIWLLAACDLAIGKAEYPAGG
mgnify:FL=1